MRLRKKVLPLVLLASVATSVCAELLIGPLPYRAGDQPFGAVAFDYWYLENFDDDLTPNIGVIPPSNGFAKLTPDEFTDSVDGRGTSSFYPRAQSVTFAFDPNAPGLKGRLPTHAGIVWTDIGFTLDFSTPFVGNVRFEAFDKNGTSLGVIGPQPLGDGTTALANTAEDMFFGVIHQDGISAITISMDNSIDWEIDDLQFGYAPVAANAAPPFQIPPPNPRIDPSNPALPTCVDKRKPVIKLAKRFDRRRLLVRRPLDISGTISDDCEIAAVNILVKNDLVYSSRSNTIRYTLNPLRYKNGAYAVRVTALDNAKNVKTKRFKAIVRISQKRRAQLTNPPPR